MTAGGRGGARSGAVGVGGPGGLAMLCSVSPAPNSRWMTWSCRSRGDPVAIVGMSAVLLGTGVGELEGERGLVSEGGGHLEVVVVERGAAANRRRT